MKTILDRENLVFNPPELGCVLSLTGLPGGDDKIYDRSHHSNLGTITGATWTRLESGLWTLSLDGNDDKVAVTNTNALDITGSQIALESWVKLNGDVGAGQYPGLIGKRNTGEGYLLYWGPSNLIAVSIYCSGGRAYTNRASFCSADVWNHITMTYDGANIKLYLNGAWVQTTAQAMGNITSSSNDIVVGQADAYYLNACVAIPRIHNRILGDLEIQNHFNQEKHLFGV